MGNYLKLEEHLIKEWDEVNTLLFLTLQMSCLVIRPSVFVNWCSWQADSTPTSAWESGELSFLMIQFYRNSPLLLRKTLLTYTSGERP